MQTEPKPIHLQGGKIMKKAVKDSNLLELYTQMKRIRVFEQRVGELFARGQSAGSMLHLSIGEEAAAVGIGSSMRKGDSFTTHHRGHGIFLARGADPKLMMAEIAGKKTGYCQGKGGSMHIADMNLGHLGANAIVGGGIPAVIGAGIASKRQGKGSVSIAFFGDGAMQQGILYESMNMASLWNLPVMFVCINNQYGMGTRIDLATKETRLHLRAEAFGLHGKTVDGLDVLDVKSAAQKMIDEARGGTPSFLAIDCYRFHGHARMDKSPYRSNEEEKCHSHGGVRIRDQTAPHTASRCPQTSQCTTATAAATTQIRRPCADGARAAHDAAALDTHPPAVCAQMGTARSAQKARGRPCRRGGCDPSE